jgi:Flp pilus assembly protein TadG
MKLGGELRGMPRVFSRALACINHLRGEDGTELVEFAFVVPWLVAMITGVMSFALAFYNLQLLGNATTTGVQLAAEDQGLVTDPCETAATTVENALPGWATTKLTFTMTWTDSGGTSHTSGPTAEASSTSFTCTSAGSGAPTTEMAPNTPVVLTVKYTYSWLPILKFVVSSPLTATEASVAD